MKKILVTGATGFIGNHIIEQLVQRGHKVITSSSGYENAITKSWYPHIKHVPFNLEDYDPPIDYYALFGYPDAMIHLAWEGLPNYKASFHLEENLPRHTVFIENMIAHGLRDLTVTGTCLEYGLQEGCLSENMETYPGNAYAQAKDLLRRKLEQLQQEIDFQFKWVRLFYMYGAGQNPNSLLSQLDRAIENGETFFNMSGGQQERDYLPVEEVAGHIIDIALQDKVNGIINCCSGEPTIIRAFVENYLKKKDAHIRLNLGYYPYPDYEPMRFWGDNRKLKTIKQ